MNSTKKQPSKIAQWILSKILERSAQNSVIGVFDEFYSEIRKKSNSFKTSTWYWKQTLP